MELKELRKLPMPKLRDVAKQETELKNVIALEKEELIKAIAAAQGIPYDETHKDLNAIHAVKQDIRALQKQKAELLTSSDDRKKIKKLRRKVKLMKRVTRHLAARREVGDGRSCGKTCCSGCSRSESARRFLGYRMTSLPPVRGRGAAVNPKNRFESIERVPEPPQDSDDISSPQTQFFVDSSKSIIAYNDSPDVGFDASVNPYRGCEHGCVYCYARPSHEYLGFSSGLDFETKIMVKEDAPELLRQQLSSRAWKPQLIALSGNTDCYQPAEKKRQLTRRCLEVLLDFRNPVVIITKNHLVTRDIDILSELARYDCVGVTLSLTTLDH